MVQIYNLSPNEVSEKYKTDLVNGLTSIEALERLKKFGFNQLPDQQKISILTLLINQFTSLIVWILIIAALIAGFLGEWIDASAIGVIVLLNGALGFFQEYRAEKSLAALRKMVTPVSKVFRDGQLQSISSRNIVNGDLILIEAGDKIPADGRFINSVELATQEASLTGESLPIKKTYAAIEGHEIAVGDRINMGFLGTIAVSGKGVMIVTTTGVHTELGKIAALLKQGNEEATPLQSRLEDLGQRLVWVCLGIVGVIFALGFIRGTPMVDNLLISASLAVAAIPEGLPAIVTISLSIGVQKMAKRSALIRKLPSVETLGCTTVICTDKTGTLTQNEMVVREVWVNQTHINVTGIGYQPEGYFEINHAKIDPQNIPELLQLLRICLLCNGAELNKNQNMWTITGDPTEGALLSVAGKASLYKKDVEKEYPFVSEIPFDSDRKIMSIARQAKEGRILFTKGATDIILGLSKYILMNGERILISKDIERKIFETNSYLASKALRVLAFAYRPVENHKKINSGIESELIFVGLAAMMDPPRPEVKQSIMTCRNAGIRPVMITGDHKETAVAIGKELGLLEKDSLVLTGSELDHMDNDRFNEQVQNIAIYARTSAAHKLRIVHALKSRGEVVAMTGDGVNDAPAIKEADIGIAMGINGSDVSIEASDMVILDDNFSSIVNAVEEGRGIYDNIIKFVNYLMSSNIAELLVIFLGMLIGFTDPLGNPFIALTAVQLLWLNLVTDGFPAITLGLDPVDPMAMKRPPRKSKTSIFPLKFAIQLLLISFIIASGALVACHFGLRQNAKLAQTMTFTTLVVLELVRVQMVRSKYNMSLFSNPYIIWALLSSFILQLAVIYTPFLQITFGTVALHLVEWAVIFIIAFVAWLASNIVNLIFAKISPPI